MVAITMVMFQLPFSLVWLWHSEFDRPDIILLILQYHFWLKGYWQQFGHLHDNILSCHWINLHSGYIVSLVFTQDCDCVWDTQLIFTRWSSRIKLISGTYCRNCRPAFIFHVCQSDCLVFDRKWIPLNQDVGTGMQCWKWSGKIIRGAASVNEEERLQQRFLYMRTCVVYVFFVSLLAGCSDDGWRAKEGLRQRRAMSLCCDPIFFNVMKPSTVTIWTLMTFMLW